MCGLHAANQASPIEIPAQANVSAIPYNGQFPGSLLPFKERPQGHGRYLQATPEQLHCQGQKSYVDVDGAAEEGAPFIPARSRVAY
jgi:hypothetical protein